MATAPPPRGSRGCQPRSLRLPAIDPAAKPKMATAPSAHKTQPQPRLGAFRFVPAGLCSALMPSPPRLQRFAPGEGARQDLRAFTLDEYGYGHDDQPGQQDDQPAVPVRAA